MFPSAIGVWREEELIHEKVQSGNDKGTFRVIFSLTGSNVGDKGGMVYYEFVSLTRSDTQAVAILVLDEVANDHIKFSEEPFLINTGNAILSTISLESIANDPDSLFYKYKSKDGSRWGHGTLKRM